ncbi:kinase-like domain-containing protein [Massariosphaeria phaeospora]|uniref:Kinase-like domain-containing protein n=1 Tax=Massariosphaeria phaeospora TaxID=100035 RepID=A0A7C8IBX0_9PLEO|nr:kinase-like domain-containing protein [Massariosphaeria phaeospora]
MAGHHLGLNGRSISESPKPMNASLYPTSNSLVKDSGTSVRKLNETFPESPKSARKRSGNEHTSRMRLAEIHTRPVRFFWFHASGEILPTTNIDTIPSFSTTPLLWCDTLSRENESRSVVQAFACKLEENGSQELVAVKQVLSRDPEEKRKAFEEVELLAKARHRHIVACLGSYLYRDKLCIIQFPVAKYNLAQYLQARSNYIQFRNVQEEGEIEHMRRLVSYFACLCTAVKYIHELGIKHRDIKPENILIDRYNTVLLTDFDISKQRDIAEKTDGPTVCTVKYSSRDVCLGVPRDFSSDVFSLGCVFMEMATIALGRTIKSLYEAVGMGSETGFEVTYWQSVENEKARGWFSELNSASSTKDKERSAVETHSLRLPGHDHLARIEAMMSNTEGARPSLADIHQTFGSLRDQCDDCVVSAMFTLTGHGALTATRYLSQPSKRDRLTEMNPRKRIPTSSAPR